MKKVLSAALLAALLVAAFAPQVDAIRRKEERAEDIQRAMAQLAQSIADPNIKFAVEILAGLAYEDPYEFVDHDLRAGRKDQSRDDIQDFKVERENWAVRARKVMIQEVGNPAQILMGRMGPDNAEYNHDTPREPGIGHNLGHIAWRAWNEDEGWPDNRVGQLYVRYQGRSRGSMHFQTSGEDRLVIHANGQLELHGPLLSDEKGAYLPVFVNTQMRKLRIE